MASKKILYLGHDPERYSENNVYHFPVIETQKFSLEKEEIQAAFSQANCLTHLIMTSRQAVICLIEAIQAKGIEPHFKNLTVFSIGEATSLLLKEKGFKVSYQAQEPTAASLVDLLKNYVFSASHTLFYPHSALSSPLLANYLIASGIQHIAVPLYTTVPKRPSMLPSLSQFEEIVFTSPSTVDAFYALYGKSPKEYPWVAIGPVTKQYIENFKGR